MRAVEQVAAGAHPEDVAASLGMHRKTVYGWGLEEHQARPVDRTSAKTREEFVALVRAALRRLQRHPYLVRGFFADPDLAHITT